MEGKELKGQMSTKPKGMRRGLEMSRAAPGLEEGHTGHLWEQ